MTRRGLSRLGIAGLPGSQRGLQHARPGFTFTEVLFAVMLLGIGFIMAAAIFPVAIRQSESNRDDTNGISVFRAGAELLKTGRFRLQDIGLGFIPTGPFPVLPSVPWTADGLVHRFDEVSRKSLPPNVRPVPLLERIRGDLIDKTDPRFAWVPLGYRLLPCSDPPEPGHSGNPWKISGYEVYVVAVACRNKSAYDQRDVDGWTFRPKDCYFYLSEGGDLPDTLTFCKAPTSLVPVDHPAAAEGAFVVVADDQLPLNDPMKGLANGRIYRLGRKRTEAGPGVWELEPGQDMTYIRREDREYNENLPPRPVGKPPKGSPARGLMIGRGYADPLDPRSPLEGRAQDLFAMPIVVFFQL